jgi:hypothetical protein
MKSGSYAGGEDSTMMLGVADTGAQAAERPSTAAPEVRNRPGVVIPRESGYSSS